MKGQQRERLYLKILKAYKNDYGRLYIVLDNIPKMTYEKSGKDYVGSATLPDGTIVFSRFLKKHSCRGAFCGAVISLNMGDGCYTYVQDYWHDEGPYKDHGEFVVVGCGTVQGLQECYIYESACINKKVLDKLLDDYLEHDDFCTYKALEDWVKSYGEQIL